MSNQPMIDAFQTGAHYAPEGQKVAFMEVAGYEDYTVLVAFVDTTRNLAGFCKVTRAKSYGPVTREDFMAAYKGCKYDHTLRMPTAMCDALSEAAKAVPDAGCEEESDEENDNDFRR